METNRVGACCDGVIAVVITIMVLELKLPHQPTWQAPLGGAHAFMTHLLGFICVGLYWNHHRFAACRQVDGKVMRANPLFLFRPSLFPFTTARLDDAEPCPAPVPTRAYESCC